MKLFVSAGEASSDLHGSNLIRALKKQTQCEAFGLGGKKLAEVGVQLWMSNQEFSVGGGPFDILAKWPKRRKLEKLLTKSLIANAADGLAKPDIALLIDSGELNLRLASLLHFFKVPVVYYIPPKVWVWRAHRLEAIKQHVDLVLSILPFEEPIYQSCEIPFEYVGNPLLDSIPWQLTQDQAKKELNIAAASPVITLMPGSRHNEVKMHVAIFAKAVALFLAQAKNLAGPPVILVPAAPTIDAHHLQLEFAKYLPDYDVRVLVNQNYLALKAAQAAIVKSGTSTLEAAALEVPMVLAYSATASAAWVYRNIVRYRGMVGLVNLFLEPNVEAALGLSNVKIEPVVPELILEKCNPQQIAHELAKVFDQNSVVRQKQLAAFKTIKSKLASKDLQHHMPSQVAATQILKLFEKTRC